MGCFRHTSYRESQNEKYALGRENLGFEGFGVLRMRDVA